VGNVQFKDRLLTLLKKASINVVDFSENVGIDKEVIMDYIGGEEPSLQDVLKIADYFDISLDYLCGRCSEELTSSIENNYGSYFMKLRRTTYEYHKVGRKENISVSRLKCEAPYPYNLLNALYDKSVEGVLIKDNEDMLNHLINKALDSKAKLVLLAYYKDGKNMPEIGAELGVSRERIHQILRRSLAKLKHPYFFKLITEGLTSYESLKKTTIELRQKEEMLKERELDLYKREAEVNKLWFKMQSLIDNNVTPVNDVTLSLFDIEKPETLDNLNDSLVMLDLSPRAFNALSRNGYKTIKEIIDKFSTPQGSIEIQNLKGVGNSIYLEIADKLNAYMHTAYD